MTRSTDKRSFFLIALIQTIPKRVRFVMSALIMTALMMVTIIYFNFYTDWYILPILFVTSYVLTFFSVLEGIEKGEWLTLFIMPTLFTIAAYLFYFLFPERWLTRLPFLIVYGFSFYAILLTSNIFNVGVEKNIQLYRAAFSVNFLYQSLLMFLAMIILLSFRQGFFVNGMVAFLVAFPLSLQVLWSVQASVHIPKNLFSYSLFMSILVMQIAMLLSFVPIRLPIFALFVTACYYSLSGLTYHYIDQRLFRQTVNEYVFVFIFVSIVCLLTIRW